MYYLGWRITNEKLNRKLQFIARRSTYSLIYEMSLYKICKRIEHAENEIQRLETKEMHDYEEV